MRVVSFGVVLFLLSFSQISWGNSETCSRILTHYENLQVSRDSFGGTLNPCYISLHPMNVKDLKYRDYLLTDQGLLMIFNSYGDGPVSRTTGAREYFFFPRSQVVPQVELEPESKMALVKINPHLQATFSIVSAQINEVLGAQVQVDPDINPNNQGGVEIKNYQGLMLDLGFAMGQSPAQNKNRVSRFTDELGNICDVKNSQLFSYANNNVVFAHTDQELKKLLSKVCPNLKVSF